MRNAFLNKIQQTPIIYFGAIIICVFILAIGISSSKLFFNIALNDEKKQFSDKLSLINSVVDPDDLSTFKALESDTLNQKYIALQSRFIGFCNRLNEIRYIYLIGKKNDQIFFYLDTESDANKVKSRKKTAFSGQLYVDAPKEYLEIFETKEQLVLGPYKDQWGEFISVASPVLDRKGNVIAVIGADMLAADWAVSIQSRESIPIIVSLIFIVVIGLVSVFLRYRIDSEGYVKLMFRRFSSFFNSSEHATILYTMDYKILAFNKKASERSSYSWASPLKVGEKLTDCIEQGPFRSDLINNTQLLLNLNTLSVEVKFEDRFYTLVYNYVQQFETEEPFISLIIIDSTRQKALQQEVFWLESEINAVSSNYQYGVVFFNQNFEIKKTNAFFNSKYTTNNQANDNLKSILSPESINKLTSAIYLRDEIVSSKTLELQLHDNLGDESDVFGQLFEVSNNISDMQFVLVLFENDLQNNRIIELKQSLANSDKMLDSLPGFVYRCKNDQDWTMLYLSHGFEDITGYLVSDILNNSRKSFNDLILPKYREYIYYKWQQCLKNQEPFEEEYQIMSLQGTPIWVLERGFGIFDDEHNVIELQGFVTNISDLKNVNEQHLLDKKKLRSYLDYAPIAFVQMDGEGKIIRANQMFLDLTGYELDLVLNMKLSSIIQDKALNSYAVFLKKLIDFKSSSEDVIMVNKLNEEKQIRLESMKLGEDELLVFLIDNTDRYQSQQLLLTQHRFLQNIISYLNIPYWVINVSNRSIAFANAYAQSHFYADFNSCVGMCQNLKTSCSSKGACLMYRAVETKESQVDEISVIDNESEIKYYKLYLSPIINNLGDVDQVIEYLVDITDTKLNNDRVSEEVTKAHDANMAKTEFLANISHEIRTPMNGIIGVCDMLMATPVNEMQKNYLRMINDSADNLLSIINNILDFAKIEVGKVSLVKEPFVLIDFFDSLIMLFSPTCDQKGIDLIAHIDKSIPYEIVSDEIRLRQLLINIIGNAVKFTNQGFVKVRMYAKTMDQIANLVFEIEDTGVGIPPDKIDLIFEDFIQLESDPSIQSKGSGLGLAISKSIVQLFNGSITVKNKVDHGTIFQISIPVDTVNRLDDKRPHSNTLVVVNDDVERAAIEDLFLTLNHEVVVCKTMVEAYQWCTLSTANNKNFDNLIVDYSIDVPDLSASVKRLSSLVSIQPKFYLLCKQNDVVNVQNTSFSIKIDGVLTKPLISKQLDSFVQKNSPSQNQILSELNLVSLPESTIVLVVEDNPINMLIIRDLIEATGAQVIEAVDGQEAYQKFITYSPSLIFMDIHLPIMDGFEATKLIRAFCKENQNQPYPYIIALTADLLRKKMEHYLDFGMDDYIAKPYKIGDVNISLKKYLKYAESI